MTRPALLMLLYTAAPAWVVEARAVILCDVHSGNQDLGGRAQVNVQPRQWTGPIWFFASATTTTTTLTVSVPGPTSSTSLSSGGPPSSDGASRSTTPGALPETAPGLPLATPLPGAGSPQASSSEVLVTDTMPADIATSTGPPPTTDISNAIGSLNDGDGDSERGSNRTLVITLSTVLSAVGLLLVIGAVLLCRRCRRRRRLPFLPRGVSPIDDDEIERWKGNRSEKGSFHVGDTDVEADGALSKETGAPSHAKHSSTSSVKKPPSVIVYSSPHNRHSTDAQSRRSIARDHPAYGGKSSFDKTLPQTPIQARAPNARAGLTDESVPGDAPFLPKPKRTPSRLSKVSHSSAKERRARHARARSSRSSTRSFGDYYYYHGTGGGAGGSGAGSELELSPRLSHDHVHIARHSSHSKYHSGTPRGSHSRVYSSSSIPPRLSFGDEVLYGGLSPAWPRFAREGEIGRAIG
ncbi:hypothetical protein C8A03DRAFT_11472 [Achaetomium macrosporum]|uniref:Uncharacterized protein n=1 Tax=Achaetomium macrosporum TaxID=79813 RepID=A0AAN7CHW1_9PEZI|nr:hypothetical protein C8A03DRAFT_11472 [Achaetomium macrosporum]